MARRIFITATNTNIGKTYAVKKLTKAFSEFGLKVGVYKPIETGVRTIPVDAKNIFRFALKYNNALRHLTLEDIAPIQLKLPAAPYIANNALPIDTDLIQERLHTIETHCDIVIIEGAGGLMVPVDKTYMMVDLITLLECHKALLVTHCSLGCINDTLLSEKLLLDKQIDHAIAFNCKLNAKSFYETSHPFFKNYFGDILFLDKHINEIAKILSE